MIACKKTLTMTQIGIRLNRRSKVTTPSSRYKFIQLQRIFLIAMIDQIFVSINSAKGLELMKNHHHHLIGGQVNKGPHGAALWNMDISSFESNSQMENTNAKAVGDYTNKSSVSAQVVGNNSMDALGNVTNSAANNNLQTEDEGSLISGVIVANSVIFLIGFCGNSLVILVILKFTRIETVTDIYILNLAFADLMFLLGLVFLIVTMIIDHWIFGNLMCKLYMASTSLNQFASSLLLVVMSFDRFLAVCHPIYAQRFRRIKKAKIICLIIWIACLIMMTPIFLFAKTNKERTCAIFWPEYKSFNYEIAFTLYSFAIGFALPLLLIAAFYRCVIRKLRTAAKGQISLSSARRTRSRESANKRIEHLVIGIICTYTICWLPYWISQLCVSFTTTLERSPIEGFYPFVLVATCLSYTNSALNPILYAFLSDNFKRRCANVFGFIYSLKWCRQTSQQANTDIQLTVATDLCEASRVMSHSNHQHHLQHPQQSAESRQTVVMKESVRLVTSPNQLADMTALTSTLADELRFVGCGSKTWLGNHAKARDKDECSSQDEGGEQDEGQEGASDGVEGQKDERDSKEDLRKQQIIVDERVEKERQTVEQQIQLQQQMIGNKVTKLCDYSSALLEQRDDNPRTIINRAHGLSLEVQLKPRQSSSSGNICNKMYDHCLQFSSSNLIGGEGVKRELGAMNNGIVVLYDADQSGNKLKSVAFNVA